MKALLYILIGPIFTCVSFWQMIAAHEAGQKPIAFLCILGAFVGIAITLIGLTRNHRDHTRR